MRYNPFSKALQHIFMNNTQLRKEVEKEELVHLESEIIRVDELRERALAWNLNDRFLLDLALNLYDCTYVKVDLSHIDDLNEIDREIALTAIRIRFFM